MVWNQMSDTLEGMRCVGVVEENPHRKTAKIGVPLGIIAALIPATSPVSTTLFLAAISIKSGTPPKGGTDGTENREAAGNGCRVSRAAPGGCLLSGHGEQGRDHGPYGPSPDLPGD